jgi:hypothetical protein
MGFGPKIAKKTLGLPDFGLINPISKSDPTIAPRAAVFGIRRSPSRVGRLCHLVRSQHRGGALVDAWNFRSVSGAPQILGNDFPRAVWILEENEKLTCGTLFMMVK